VCLIIVRKGTFIARKWQLWPRIATANYQAEPLVSCAGDIRVHDYHDVDVGGGEVVMVALRFVSVLLGKKVPNKST